MEPRFLVEELAGEPEVEDERSGAGGVRVRCGRAEGVGEPGPQERVVRWARDFAWRVQLVSMDVVDRDSGSVGAQGRDGDVAK
jgi:hypothetical protein